MTTHATANTAACTAGLARPTPPPLTVEEKHVPPQAESPFPTSAEEAFEAEIEGFGQPDRCEEYPDVHPGPVRFDEPEHIVWEELARERPILLERRGATSQVPDLQNPSPAPRGRDLSNLKPKVSQAEFWAEHTAHKNSVAAKLREHGHPDLADQLEQCHYQ